MKKFEQPYIELLQIEAEAIMDENMGTDVKSGTTLPDGSGDPP